MAVKMWPTLPKDDEDNGLGRIERAMIDNPDAEFVVVGRVTRKRLNVEDDKAETTPTLKFLCIEPILVETDANTAAELLQEAFRKRQPQKTLDEAMAERGEDDN